MAQVVKPDSGGRLLSEYDGAGACARDYLYLGGKMIGEYQPATSTYYYYASDQINSTRLVTDAAGNVVHSVQYDPYGGLYKIWMDTYHPKPGFSGKEREPGADLDYFGARYYGHRQYRFLSVDPVINKEKALSDPQYWNLYAYCGNNPISKVDPDGRTIWDIVDFASFAHSAYTFIKNPSWGHAGDLTLDTLGLLPIIPALGTIKKTANLIDKADDVNDTRKAINNSKRFSKEKEALVDMAKMDKKRGMTKADMEAYEELNRQLPDPFPDSAIRGPEIHPNREPQAKQSHGHVGPVDHIPIKDKT